MPRREASAPIVKKRKPKQQRQPLTGKQRAFAEEYLANGRNGAAAYRKVYRSRANPDVCAVQASKLLDNPKIAVIIASNDRMLALVQQKVLEEREVTEERIIETIASLAFYDPRELISWGREGLISFTPSEDLPYRSVLPIREISSLANGGLRIRFHDRRAALMDLARLRGMLTDKSGTFHLHEDLARMPPDQQKRRVSELLEFAASIRVPESMIDVTPPSEEESEE